MSAWETVIDEYRLHLRDDQRTYVRSQQTAARAGETRKMYVQHIRWLADSMSAIGPWDVTARDLTIWLEGQNWSANTRKRVVTSLRTFYAWGVREGPLEWAPTAGLPTGIQGRRGSGPPRMSWAPAWLEPIDQFVLACRSRGNTEATIDKHLQRLRLLMQSSADPWAVTTQHLEQWLSNPDWAPQTRRGSRSAAILFYRWAARAGRIAASPAEDLPSIRTPRALPRPASHETIRAALAAADDRTRLMILLAVDAGLRRAEIAALHTNQVTDTHILVVGKGGNQRVVPLDPDGDLARAIRVERERRRRGEHGTGWGGRFVSESGYLFPTDEHPGPLTPRYVGMLIARAMPEGTAHMLRHRFATDAYAEERDIQAVQELLGHSKPETTSVYAQVPDGATLAAVMGANARRQRHLARPLIERHDERLVPRVGR